MRCRPVMEHHLPHFDLDRNGRAFVRFRHRVAGRLDALVIPKLIVDSRDHLHTSVLPGQIVKRHQARYHCIRFINPEVIVVLVPRDLPTHVSRFVEALAKNHPEILTNNRLNPIQYSGVSDQFPKQRLKQMRTPNLIHFGIRPVFKLPFTDALKLLFLPHTIQARVVGIPKCTDFIHVKNVFKREIPLSLEHVTLVSA